MYRPTVRMSDVFKDYVEALAAATTLDRNQILRLALFNAPFNEAFLEVLKEYQRPGVQVPSPSWEDYEYQYFLEKDPPRKVGKGGDVQPKITEAPKPAAAEKIAQPAQPKGITWTVPAGEGPKRPAAVPSRPVAQATGAGVVQTATGGIKITL